MDFQQVWAPLFTLSPFDREYRLDIERAFENWAGEQRIWLSPEVDGVVRWAGPGNAREALVPTRRFNRVDIYHVDGSLRTYPPRPVGRWKTRLPRLLYRQWLNSKVVTRSFPGSIVLKWPVIRDGTFAEYEDRTFEPQSPPILPIADYDPGKNAMRFDFTWAGHGPQPVSPETESRDVYGVVPPLAEDELGHQVTIMTDADGRQTKVQAIDFQWQAPMDELLPYTGIDVLKHRDVMGSCIKTINHGDADYAIRIAMAMTALFAGEGVTTRRLADFLPAYSGADTPEAQKHSLWDIAERLGVNADTWDEVLHSPVFRLKRDEPVPVTRLLSWLGYFWWEFTRDITEYRLVGFCQRCGRVIAGGHMDRKFCKRDENLDCYRAAEAARKRMDRRGKRAAYKGA